MRNHQNQKFEQQVASWRSWMFSRMTIFFALGVLAAGTYVAPYLERSTDQNVSKKQRQLASYHQEHSHAHRHTSKLKSPVKAKIELLGDAPKASGDRFTILASVASPVKTDKVELNWIVPEGVDVVKGSQKLEIPGLRPNEVRRVEIVFEQVSESNEQIHLQVSSLSGSMEMSQVLQYNSLKQERIQKLGDNLREVAAEHMRKDLAIKSMENQKSSDAQKISH